MTGYSEIFTDFVSKTHTRWRFQNWIFVILMDLKLQDFVSMKHAGVTIFGFFLRVQNKGQFNFGNVAR